MIINDQSSAGTERKVWYCVKKNHKTDAMRIYGSAYTSPKAYVISNLKCEIIDELIFYDAVIDAP